jgi:DNA-binding CsgD family transcriptional regulator
MDGRCDDDWLECYRALEGSGLGEEEAKVAWLVSRGRTNGRIAGDLGFKPSKVKWLLRVIFIKLAVPDRHALGELVQDRLAGLRKREERRRPRGTAGLRIAQRPRPPPRDGDGERRSAPDA